MGVNFKENKSLGWVLSVSVAVIAHCYLFIFFQVSGYKENLFISGSELPQIYLADFTSPASGRGSSLLFTDLVTQNLLPDSKAIAAKAPENLAHALYLQYWRAKVERIGRLNYPAVAAELESYKDIQLSVILQANGQLRDVKFLQSSGSERLDQAIIKIIEQAAPFAPLLGTAEQVEIVTHWDLGQTYAFNARTY